MNGESDYGALDPESARFFTQLAGLGAEREVVREPILTGRVGSNADQFPDVLSMYVPAGVMVADVTYGRGVFWRNVEDGRWRVVRSDLDAMYGVDVVAELGALPYRDGTMGAVILDPPYAHGGATMKESINRCYRNANGGHQSIVDTYRAGVAEAARVLTKGGVLIVKCQDEIESGHQRWTHVEVMGAMDAAGFEVVDLFVLVQTSTPAMRQTTQLHARKNHSYWLVGRRRRGGSSLQSTANTL